MDLTIGHYFSLLLGNWSTECQIQFQHLRCIKWVNPHTTYEADTIVIPFYRWRNRGPERLGNVLKVPWLVVGSRVELEYRQSGTRACVPHHSLSVFAL